MSKAYRALLATAVVVGGLCGSGWAQNPADWSYGAFNGPSKWAGLFPTYCAAETGQSPIAIPADVPVGPLPNIQFAYNAATFLVENINYATEILAPTEEDSPTNSIKWNGAVYKLLQVHFHFPPEHTIAKGENTVMEVHFVHQDAAKKNYLVIAVLAEINGSNQGVTDIWNNLPPSYGGHGSVTINPSILLPGDGNFDQLGYYLYTGSLTTPRCDPGVTWLVLKRRIGISVGQLAKARCNTYENARPIPRQSSSPVITQTKF